MNDIELLKDFRQRHNLSQTQCAEALGVSSNLIARIEMGNRNLTPQLNEKILEVYGENLLNLDPTPENTLKQFRKKHNISQTELANILGVSKGLVASIECGDRNLSLKFNQKILDIYGENLLFPEQSKDILPNNNVAIPFFPDAQAAAGKGEILPLVETKEVFYCDKRWLQNVIGARPESTIVIIAKGNSMDSGLNLKDDIKDGDLLFVDFNNKEIINNKTYVIQQGNNLRVKKLKKEFNGDLYLVSNNEKEYPVEKVAEETTVVGRVMWNISMENV